MTDKLSKGFSILFVAFDQRIDNQDIQTATKMNCIQNQTKYQECASACLSMSKCLLKSAMLYGHKLEIPYKVIFNIETSLDSYKKKSNKTFILHILFWISNIYLIEQLNGANSWIPCWMAYVWQVMPSGLLPNPSHSAGYQAFLHQRSHW